MDRKPVSHLRAVSAPTDEVGVVSNAIDPLDAEFIARSNAIVVTIDMMWRGCDAILKLPVERKDWYARMDCLTQLFRGQRNTAFVVNSRLEAMFLLLDANSVPCGVVPMDAGWTGLTSSVFLAAAETPILFLKRRPYFEPGPFAAFVLKDARTCGDLTGKITASTARAAVRTESTAGFPGSSNTPNCVHAVV